MVEQWPFDNICGLQCPRDSLTTFEKDGDAAAALGCGGDGKGTESSTAEGRRHFQHYKVEAKAAAKAAEEEERRNNITKLGPFGPFAFLIS